MNSARPSIIGLESQAADRRDPPATSVEADRPVVIDCFIAGFRYHEGLDIMSYLQPGEEIQLIAEPGNPHDEWAVRLEHRKSRIGYLPRGQNQIVSRLLQQGAPGGVECRITAVDPHAVPWEAVKVQVTTAP